MLEREREREKYSYWDRHVPPIFQVPNRNPDNFTHFLHRRNVLNFRRKGRNLWLRSRNGAVSLVGNLTPLAPLRYVDSPASPRILEIPIRRRCGFRNVSERRRFGRRRRRRAIWEGALGFAVNLRGHFGYFGGVGKNQYLLVEGGRETESRDMMGIIEKYRGPFR